MPMTGARLCAVILGAGLLAPGAAAGEGLIKRAGSDFGQGAAEALQPALAATIADVDRRLLRHEERIGSIAGGLVRKADVVVEQRLDQVDRILETRLLQAKVEASDLADQTLGRVDQLARDRLDQVDLVGRRLVKRISHETQQALAAADAALEARIADVGQTVHGALEKADGALADRITQLDELAGRRLGNIDVIASKQRIALERTVFRLSIVIGLVVFLVYVLRKLWARYQEIVEEEPDPAPGADNGGKQWRARGSARAWLFVRELGKPLFGYVAGAAVLGALVFLLHDQLPLGAQKEALALARTHELGLERGLERFEFTRVLFHASQLEHLTSGDGGRYRALAAKAELLRDMFARPTLWATDGGLAQLSDRAAAVRRLLDGAPDPDLLVVEAMLLWQTGGARRDEHRAASLCARALRLKPRGFALAPMARAHVEAFLQAPLVEGSDGLGRDAESVTDLRAILELAAPDSPDHPLATPLGLARRMRELDAAAARAYLAMALAHRDLVRAQRPGGERAAAQTARGARTKQAREVVQLWAAFDGWLAGSPLLAGNPAVLSVFRLNDAFYVRAKWFAEHPETDQAAPLLAASLAPAPAAIAGKGPPGLALAGRLELAPPRVVWARRYRPLMSGPARSLLELQEFERFQRYERDAHALEAALLAADAPGADADADAATAAVAARLGLFVDQGPPGSHRVPYARVLVPTPAAGARPDAREEALGKLLQVRGVRVL